MKVDGHASSPLDAARAAVEAATGGPAVAIVTVVDAPVAGPVVPGRRLLLAEGGEARGTLGDAALDRRANELAQRALAGAPPITEAVEVGADRYLLYVDAERAPEHLVIVGAGHIAVPLAHIGALLGFRVTVLDDREEFATTERFPEAAAVIRADFSDPFRDVQIGARSYLVLVTRGHKYDFDCLARVLRADASPRYVGMIGSRRRVRAAFHSLIEGGIPREKLERVRAPLGLDIGAETPEEIAVSIAAELVQVRRMGESERAAPTLTAQERVLQRLLPDREGR